MWFLLIGLMFLDLDNFKYNYLIDHYIVDTGIKWTRAGLQNYGIKRTKTPYFISWDADIMFFDDTMKKLNDWFSKRKEYKNKILGLKNLKSSNIFKSI